jgi:hypothetical protein
MSGVGDGSNESKIRRLPTMNWIGTTRSLVVPPVLCNLQKTGKKDFANSSSR